MLQNDVSKYLEKTKKSRQLYEKAKGIFAGGTSHNARFFEPYPFFVRKARGKYLWDVDGNKYTDYWTGHTALILGHSPKIVAEALEEQSENGTLFGTVAEQAVELGEIVRSNVPCAKLIRFCNTGAEATMYAVRLARAFNSRKIVAKVEGGWHGYNTTLVKGVTSPFEVPESAGLIEQENQFVQTFKFNDIASVESLLRESRGEVACIILEPVLGGGGCIPPAKEFLSSLREICTAKDIVLVFDEIITGFRLAFGGAQEYYGVTPDLATFGKILGGGLPIGAIAGLEEIMELADASAKKGKTERCWIGGGTFSDNPMTMASGLATLRFLEQNKNGVYQKLTTLGDMARNLIDSSFKEEGVPTKTTGAGSLLYTHFLHEGQRRIESASDSARANTLLEKNYYFSLIVNNDIFFLPGHLGAISLEHIEEDIRNLALASRQFAERHAKLVQSVSPKLV